MEGAAGPYNSRTVEEVFKDFRTVEEVFKDFKGRRAGMIKALTTDWEEFYQQCVPGKEKLCLFGFPSKTWEVNLPPEEVPPELPMPALGINFARDGMQEEDWLSLVAVHSDAWLLAVAFYFGARFGFEKNDRSRLFNMINELPTIFEVVIDELVKKQTKEKPSVTNHNGNKSTGTVKKQTKEKPSVTNHNGNKSTGTVKKQTKEKPSVTNHNGNKSKPNAKVQRVSESQTKVPKLQPTHKENTPCGACRENYASDEFWICCDMCETWFHGKCVKITPARAEHMKQYICPSCSSGTEDEEELVDTPCGACDENYAPDEFWIFCNMCEIWFHGKCVKITPARAKRIKQYKCPSCSSSTKCPSSSSSTKRARA